MNKKKLLVSLNINIAILCLTIIALGLSVFDAKTLDQPYIMTFKYFTALSNIFLAVSAGIMIVYEAMWLAHKRYEMPKGAYICKLSATVATTITFLVVVLFLTPLFTTGSQKEDLPIWFLYSGANFIFHLLSPILAIIVFILFETRKDIRFPQTLFALIFVALYATFYTLDVFYKFMPGDGPTAHDWYNFTILGEKFIPLILLIFVGITILLSWLLWLANRKINVLEKKTATK